MLEDTAPPFPPEKGACTGQPTDWWFPVTARGYRNQAANVEARKLGERAKAVCRTCDQVTKCLLYSIAYEPMGIWGGLDESERETMRRKAGMRGAQTPEWAIPKWSRAV
jgi:WhiB family redox-sensing transcriptional regulator|tara:strand:- start:337 stop:663 length:327 start_codon:yes stop_codon:yes gene_type:complete